MSKLTLREIRRARNFTQEELASQTGISIRTIARYEKDVSMLRRAKYEKLCLIAEILSVSVDDIFLDDDSVFMK
ncbi:DNA-binding protein [Streptococcus porcinus]|uniref:Helix-turn-helix transcriptional regulator n=1 Tax=Streptococcus porcinus TaxID=1340 RepID=A0A4U9ZUZ9_STRPO|nr:helix-turn-helix transcriptional regulator [Streptococcus porcinus]MBA2795802.1 helix-turn-helix transcriptional regulator [Streptococcus porcinus]VTS44336.1 DNA-binding protein [Streptococcus porcinus]